MRKSAFTLVELLTVVGIIMILLGAAMSGLSVIMSRTSYYTGINAHLNIHTTLSSLAKKSGNSGRVYGYQLYFVKVGSVVAATGIYPWYSNNGGSGTPTYFTSGTAMNSLLGIGLEAIQDTRVPTRFFYYDISDKVLASQLTSRTGPSAPYTPLAPFSHYWLNGTLGTTKYTENSTQFMICFEPGTGFMHALRDPPGTTLVSSMISPNPDILEFNYYNTASLNTTNYNTTDFIATRRLMLYQDGSAEIKGPR